MSIIKIDSFGYKIFVVLSRTQSIYNVRSFRQIRVNNVLVCKRQPRLGCLSGSKTCNIFFTATSMKLQQMEYPLPENFLIRFLKILGHWSWLRGPHPLTSYASTTSRGKSQNCLSRVQCSLRKRPLNGNCVPTVGDAGIAHGHVTDSRNHLGKSL